MNGTSFAIAIDCVQCYLLLIKFDLMAAQLGRVVGGWCVHADTQFYMNRTSQFRFDQCELCCRLN